MISLYFHIPFCTKKCPYCHFYVVPNKAEFRKALHEGLALEAARQAPLIAGKAIASVYFGGGTPSLFGPEGIGPILKRLGPLPDAEITIEANPEESSYELFSAFRQLGINRLSLGVQSLDDRSLQDLERIHTAQRAKDAIFDAKRAGFDNISIDLMYDLPGQTIESFRYTLDQIADLPIEHLSLYNLTIEPHTAFYKRKVQLPSSEMSLKFLNLALEKIKLKRYEISAFGRPSVHNTGYWTGRPFLGFGPSAFSYWEGERFRNMANLHRYTRALQEGRSPVDFSEKLPYPANLKELLAIRLRLLEGVLESDFAIVDPQTREKLSPFFIREEGRIRLSSQGMLYYDEIASEII